jgi:hypothetical protein
MAAGQKYETRARCAYHPQTKGKIPYRGLKTNRCRATDGWHQTLKDRIFLENHFPSGELEAQFEASPTPTIPSVTMRA